MTQVRPSRETAKRMLGQGRVLLASPANYDAQDSPPMGFDDRAGSRTRVACLESDGRNFDDSNEGLVAPTKQLLTGSVLAVR